MKKLIIGIIALFAITSVQAFDTEYQMVTVKTVIVDVPPINTCNYNLDSRILSCPMLSVQRYEEDYANEYMLQDVRLEYTKVIGNRLSFEVVSGAYVHNDTVAEIGVDANNCIYKTGIETIVCKELQLLNSFGTPSTTVFENTYFQRADDNEFRLINYVVK
jgi:hypothetical protein